MATLRSARNQAMDTAAALSDIRERLASLMNRQVTPALVEAGGQADDAFRAATDVVRDRTDAFASQLRSRPIWSIIVAAAAGFVLGRIVH